MVRYVLECPSCGDRQDLERPEPEQQRRCRGCRMILAVPGGEAGAPILEGAVRRSKPLKRLALAAFTASTVVLIGLAALVDSVRHRPSPATEPVVEAIPTLSNLPSLLPSLAWPLNRGAKWLYRLDGGGREERRVVLASSGPGGSPEFEVATTGSLQAGRRTLRIAAGGVVLAGEQREGARWTFDEPLRLLPHPIYADDAWRLEGKAQSERGEREVWALDARVVKAENVDVPAGRFPCFRVDYKGMKGARPFEEILWIAKGTGIVKRRTTWAGKVEEAVLESR
jgi:hypothetical protein